jgi:RNA polymerase sigma-70 factor (ECF subfamily)
MVNEEGGEQARVTADAVARRSYGKLVAFLAARTRDVAAAEDALSEAFAIALDDWPKNGCPANPEAWLMTVSRRKIIDSFRGHQRDEEAAEELKVMAERFEDTDGSEIPDLRLGLMFACAHPAVDVAVRAPLMLQTVLGLDAGMIASPFLVSPATMGQRLVRAKAKIKQARIPFRIPAKEELVSRLETVLDAIYAAFAEGWSDAPGTDSVRRDLTEEAIFLGRLVVHLLPEEPEALGLVALMLHAEARRFARRDSLGAYVPMAEQDTRLWDAQMIREAEELLLRASEFGMIGRYQLEAALQSAHSMRKRTGVENWDEIVQLYDALLGLSGSPVVAINRALAIAEVEGPEVGLTALNAVAEDGRLSQYQPYWAARADLLAKTGDQRQAWHAYQMAIGLEKDDSVRRFLQGRQAKLAG